ncbi:hypothetical protein [Frigoribacterium sp. PvP032]|uniref:hypothetical protein n=1 Tax=Frigoribacterium sp. PvP032 TaxID=2806589 RepID=UPI001AE55342|nr:hypothetical protein [Frigoribacterium sp. PvP032]MBP1191884.1 hypothetical protein [Frigoribacterium sp. PvP032]
MPPQPQQYGVPQQQQYGAPQQQQLPYGAPQQPYAAAYSPYAAAGATRPSSVLSILSLVGSLVGVLAVLVTFGAGVVFSIAAVVLGHIASRREGHARRLWLPGIIVGYAGIALAVIIWVAIGVFFASVPGGSSGTFDGGYGQS